MKRFLMVFFFLQICFSLSSLFAEPNKQIMFHTYLSGDMSYWKAQIDRMRDSDQLSADDERLLLLYEYEYIGYLLGQKRNSEAALYFPDAQKRLKRLLQQGSDAQLEALMAAFTGYEIGLSPYKAPFIGSKCFEHAQKAMQLAPEEPWGFLQLANVKYYAPSVFGGSKSASLELFLEAKKRFQKRDSYLNTWQYPSLLRAIAQNYEALGDFNMALQCYNSILKQYPGYKWVSEVLRPNLLKKMNK